YALRSVFRKDAHGPDSNSYLVEVRGHANDASVRNGPAPPYGSNYEISKQRADQVTLLLQSEFRRATEGRAEPSIRWLSYGVSNEESFLEPSLNPDAPTTDRKLTVEVNVQTVAAPFADGKARDTQIDVSKMVGASSLPRELDLIDYLYFTIYTITTTGYGDIVPISSWAKFLVSIANLIELLFLVVLVNVIANVRPANADGAGDTDANRS
ncbi:MAG: ion channel, partial [Thermoanaerobaculia bacterium]